MGDVRIELDTAKCQSYGKCLALAPNLFAWDRHRKVRINDPQGGSPGLALKAAKNCPYRAIAVTDSATGERIFPVPRATQKEP
jgi:ferredoxin